MEIQENKKYLNLVYDVWNEETGKPIANVSDSLGDYDFRYEEGFIDFYERYYWKQLNYDRFTIPRKLRRIEEVEQNLNENFYYFIKSSFDLREILGEKKMKFSDIVHETLKKCKNLFIVFLTEHECDNEEGFRSLLSYINEHSLPSNQFYLMNNNQKMDEYNVKYNSDIKYHMLNLLTHTSSSIYTGLKINFESNKEGKFFLCHNKTPKSHRYGILSLLKKHNIIDNVNWSLVPGVARPIQDTHTLGDIFDKELIIELEKEIQYFFEIKVKESDYEIDRKWFDIPYQINIDKSEFPKLTPPAEESGGLLLPEHMETYRNSYVNIVTETQYRDDINVIHITEKSIRPFAFYQIPVILATHHHIKKMKEKYGFDFFDDIVDHSYDNEPDIKKRILLFFNEIIRLNNNKEEIIKFYGENQHRFEKNRQIMVDLASNTDDFEFFQKLMC
jgi:hypothetical protein